MSSHDHLKSKQPKNEATNIKNQSCDRLKENRVKSQKRSKYSVLERLMVKKKKFKYYNSSRQVYIFHTKLLTSNLHIFRTIIPF